jgi:NitT/TauT family transport system substrate-binding protein
MTKKMMAVALAVFLSLVFTLRVGNTQELKYSTALKIHPVHFLSMLTAEEKGFWKKNGLEVKWFPFRRSSTLIQGVAAGSVVVGHLGAAGLLQAAARGLPVTIVSDLQRRGQMALWVRGDSPIGKAQELKGAKLGISGMGGFDYAFAKLALNALALEKDVKMVATGGIPASMAMLKRRSLEVVARSKYTMMKFALKGEVRLVVDIEKYLPKNWVTHMVFARKDFLEQNSETVGKIVKAMTQTARFIKENKSWSVQRIKSVSGLSNEGAEGQYELMEFTDDGKINVRGVENVLKFLVDYGIIPKEQAPPVEQVITLRFAG